MTPLGLAKKISTAFRILGYGTHVGRRSSSGGVGGEHYVRVWRKLRRGGEDQVGLVTIEMRDDGLKSWVEHDSDEELHEAYRELTKGSVIGRSAPR